MNPRPKKAPPSHPWRRDKVGTRQGNSEQHKKNLAAVKRRARAFAH